jgi:hypothetical protein
MVLEEMVYGVSHETEPTSFHDAISGPEPKEWIEAIQCEVSSVDENQSWEPCCLPPGRKAIPLKWVFKKKTNAEGKVCRYKAKSVCKDFMQREGIDFEMFAPVAKFQSIRCLIAIAAYYGLKLEEMDVVTAFLNPDAEEETYIQVPQGLDVPEEFKIGATALCLLKELYGLKQAPRLWNDAVNATLHRLNLTRCNPDPCLHVRKEKMSLLSSLFMLMILS